MSTVKTEREGSSAAGEAPIMDMKLEVIVIPVSDVDRAKAFYKSMGWREDADFATGADFRVVQLTPPGSGCSVIFGTGITTADPGSAQGLHLVVADIEGSRAQLADRGIEISGVFHDAGGIFHREEPIALRIVGDAVQQRAHDRRDACGIHAPVGLDHAHMEEGIT